MSLTRLSGREDTAHEITKKCAYKPYEPIAQRSQLAFDAPAQAQLNSENQKAMQYTSMQKRRCEKSVGFLRCAGATATHILQVAGSCTRLIGHGESPRRYRRSSLSLIYPLEEQPVRKSNVSVQGRVLSIAYYLFDSGKHKPVRFAFVLHTGKVGTVRLSGLKPKQETYML